MEGQGRGKNDKKQRLEKGEGKEEREMGGKEDTESEKGGRLGNEHLSLCKGI